MSEHFDRKTMVCMRRLAIIPRWQTAPAHRRGNVLEHSVGVLMIAGFVSGKLGVEYGYDQVMQSLLHDSDEAIYGDAPSTSKKAKDPAECVDVHHAIMKAADYCESLVWLNEEAYMGNKRLTVPKADTHNRAHKWMVRAVKLATGVNDPCQATSLIDDVLLMYVPDFHPPAEYS